MASTAKNRIVRTDNAGSVFPDATKLIDNTISFNQGDLLFLDTVAHLIKPLAADADTQNLLGISDITIVNGKLPSGYTTPVDASAGMSAVPGPLFGVEADMIAKAADVFVAGQEVFWDSASGNPQQVTSASPGTNARSVGVYQGAGYTAPAGGGKVRIKVFSRYPFPKAAAFVAQNTTAAATDLATSEALANSLQTTVNGLLTALKNAGIMVPA
jgi:hypothetical protein